MNSVFQYFTFSRPHWARLLLFMSLFLVCLQVNSQTDSRHKIDSLKRLIENVNMTDANANQNYRYLSWEYVKVDFDSALYNAQRYIDYFNNEDNKKSPNLQYYVAALLTKGRILGTKNRIDEGIKYFEQALAMYNDENKDSSYYIWTCEELGNYYMLKSYYSKALESYHLGLERAKSVDSALYAGYFSDYIAVVFIRLKQTNRALKFSEEAIEYFEKAANSRQRANGLVNLANILNKIGGLELAEKYLLEAKSFHLAELKETGWLGNKVALMKINFILGQILIDNGDTNALRFLLKAKDYDKEIGKTEESKNFLSAEVSNELGAVYLKMGMAQNALQEFYLAESIGREMNSLEVLAKSYQGLFNEYLVLKNVDSIKKYSELYLPVKDSLNAEILSENINFLNYEFDAKLERQNIENEIAIIQAEKKEQQLFYVSLISLLGLMGLIGFLIWYAQKNKLVNSELKRKYLRLEKEGLNNDLNRRNKELTSTVLNLIERNKFIAEIASNLEQLKISKNGDINRQIGQILRSIDKDVSKKLWKEFETRYIEVHKEFFRDLNQKYPDLTANERRLCAFIQLNMSSKEISAITYQSPQSIKIARYRMRKKLGLGKNENLTSFLSKLHGD